MKTIEIEHRKIKVIKETKFDSLKRSIKLKNRTGNKNGVHW